MENTAKLIFDAKTSHSKYNNKRLELLPLKDNIHASKLDLKFFDAMSIDDGVRAIRQFLAPIEEDRYHQNITQLPQFYARNLPDLLEFYQLKGGAYYSPNGFSKHSTAKQNILTLKTAFLDIDFHQNKMYTDSDITPVTIEEQLQVVTMILENAKLPHPTAIINSGNGLHLYYIFEEPKFDNSKDKVISRLLERVNTYLVSTFNNSIENITDINLVADTAATNSNRLLRPPLTWNGRKEVHCIQFHNTYESMDTFIKHYLPKYDEKIVKQAKEARLTSKKNHNVKKINNVNTLNVSRINDLEKLINLRNYDIEGERNIYLHIYASQYLHHANDEWEEKVHEMNDRLISRLPMQEIDTIIKSVKRKEYLYRNETLIKDLEITDEELEHLDMNRITGRQMRRLERKAKRQEKRKRNDRIVAAYESGTSQTSIAKKECIGRKTVYRILKATNIL